MSAIALIASLLLSLLVGGMRSDDQCVNTNNKTYEPYTLPAGRSPISNKVPSGAKLYTPYKSCKLVPYDYAYNASADCLSHTNNRVIDPIIPLFLSPAMLKAATLLELFIQERYKSSIHIFSVIITLHLSLDYFSCYTAHEQTGIEIGLSKYQWSSFNITFYHNISCDIDIKQGYIEFSVDTKSQLTLQTFVKGLERSVRQNGNVTIKYPRNFNQDPFHATLLTGDYRFPYDCMTGKLNEFLNETQNQLLLGLPITVEVCCFITIDTITKDLKYYAATKCTNPANLCIMDH